jgi:hypothetical protein
MLPAYGCFFTLQARSTGHNNIVAIVVYSIILYTVYCILYNNLQAAVATNIITVPSPLFLQKRQRKIIHIYRYNITLCKLRKWNEEYSSVDDDDDDDDDDERPRLKFPLHIHSVGVSNECRLYAHHYYYWCLLLLLLLSCCLLALYVTLLFILIYSYCYSHNHRLTILLLLLLLLLLIFILLYGTLHMLIVIVIVISAFKYKHLLQ